MAMICIYFGNISTRDSPFPQETRSQVDWQAWLMPMDCFSCHQGEKLLSILMSKLDVHANLEVNIDANGKVNNSDAKAEAEIIALDKISWLSTGMKG